MVRSSIPNSECPYPVVVAAKSTSDAQSIVPFPPDPNSPQSTISTVAREIAETGGQATAIPVDVRDFASVQKLVNKTIEVRIMHTSIPPLLPLSTPSKCAY